MKTYEDYYTFEDYSVDKGDNTEAKMRKTWKF